MVSLNRPTSPPPTDPPFRQWPPQYTSYRDDDRPPPVVRLPHNVRASPPLDLFPDDDSSLDSDILVRTAQASRLRRRGAIRIEAGAATSGGRSETVRPRSNDLFGDYYRSSDDEPHILIPFTLKHNVQSVDFRNGGPLYCGGLPKSRCSAPLPSSPFRPSPLPNYGEASTSRLVQAEKSSSNGCGELIHRNAAPSERLGLWLAQDRASPEVISMESQYVESGPREMLKVGRSKCGCLHEGIGCRSCGNSLGIRIQHCPRHRMITPETLTFPYDDDLRTSSLSFTYVFNPYNTTHGSTISIPFPYDLSYSDHELQDNIPSYIAGLHSPDSPIRHSRSLRATPRTWREPSVSPVRSISPTISSVSYAPITTPQSTSVSQCPTPGAVVDDDAAFAGIHASPSSFPTPAGSTPVASSSTNPLQSISGASLPSNSAANSRDVLGGQVAPALARLEAMRARLLHTLDS